jgi:ElaB/YqjD/DUF883 family membrane-anchored ribosome-binding protein
MAERENQKNTRDADTERSTEDIRQDIAKGEHDISRTLDQIDERIQEKLDWREYVKDRPYWALGAAAGLGYLASRMFLPRTTPMERIMGPIAREVSHSLGNVLAGAAGPGLIKVALLGIATKAAAGWIKNAASTAVASGRPEPRPQAVRSSTVRPRVAAKRIIKVKS